MKIFRYRHQPTDTLTYIYAADSIIEADAAYQLHNGTNPAKDRDIWCRVIDPTIADWTELAHYHMKRVYS